MTPEKKRKRALINITGYFILSMIFVGIAVIEWRSSQRILGLVILFGLLGAILLMLSIISYLSINLLLEQSTQNIKKFTNPKSSEEDQLDHELRIRERLTEVVKAKRSSYRKKFFVSLSLPILALILIFDSTINGSLFFAIIFFLSFPSAYFSVFSFGKIEGSVEDIIQMDRVSKWLD